MVVALNIWDDAKHKGIAIDIEKLSKMLQVPVVATNGITGRIEKAATAKSDRRALQWKKCTREERLETIGRIITAARIPDRRHDSGNLAGCQYASVLGLPLAVGVLFKPDYRELRGEIAGRFEMFRSRFTRHSSINCRNYSAATGFSSLLLGEISGATLISRVHGRSDAGRIPGV